MSKRIEIDQNKQTPNVFEYDICGIKTLQYSNVEYSNFFENVILSNLPCIVKNVCSNWDCSSKWIANDNINYDYFIESFGDLEAPVVNCDNVNAQCKQVMTIKNYMNYLKDSSKKSILYLKDWHFRRLRPNDNFYDVPFIFASDWLNEFAQDHEEDDFMFVYIGPENSWTPLHVDVYNSYSWSVNVVGEKKWILFPPGEEEKLKDSLGNLPLQFNPDNFLNIKYFEVIQKKGDAIFVPSGWHHEVVNTLETISINHNWVNGSNVKIVWKAMHKCLLSIEHEIEDLKQTPEFVTQCQIILKSLFGMDYASFINLLCYIAEKRLNRQLSFNGYILGPNHRMFDLCNILEIMNLIEKDTLFLNGYLLPLIKYDYDNIKQSLCFALNK